MVAAQTNLFLMTSPICRQTSKKVTPSSTFFPKGDQRDQYIKAHKEYLSRTLCRYFEASKRKNRLFCPFLNKCQFSHLVDGEKFVFSRKDIRKIKQARRSKRYGQPKELSNRFLDRIQAKYKLKFGPGKNAVG